METIVALLAPEEFAAAKRIAKAVSVGVKAVKSSAATGKRIGKAIESLLAEFECAEA